LNGWQNNKYVKKSSFTVSTLKRSITNSEYNTQHYKVQNDIFDDRVQNILKSYSLN
jgi:hypothetical protein